MGFIPEVILKYVLEAEEKYKDEKSGLIKKEWVLATLKELAPQAKLGDIMLASSTIDAMVKALNTDFGKKIKKKTSLCFSTCLTCINQ